MLNVHLNHVHLQNVYIVGHVINKQKEARIADVFIYFSQSGKHFEILNMDKLRYISKVG